MRSRHRPSKLLLRHGVRFDDGDAWTERHRQWLAQVVLPWPAAQATLLDCQGAIDALCHRREQLHREILAMLPSSPWVVQAGRLRCLRGVDTLTAVGLCAEIGDFERFARAEQLMSYIGLVPSEFTTGQQRRLGSITKTGSAHARRLLTNRSRLALPAPPAGRHDPDRPTTRPATRSDRDRLVSPAPAASHVDPPRSPREAPHNHRRRCGARTRRVLLGDHPNRVTDSTPRPHPVGWVGSGPARAGNPRLSYEQPAPSGAGHARS